MHPPSTLIHAPCMAVCCKGYVLFIGKLRDVAFWHLLCEAEVDLTAFLLLLPEVKGESSSRCDSPSSVLPKSPIISSVPPHTPHLC